MKNFTKLFLLALCTGFLFLGFSNAQNEQDWAIPNTRDYIHIVGDRPCTCGMNMLDLSVRVFLFGIKILLGVILIVTSLRTISLYKKLTDTYKHNILFCFPLINLYPLSEITIGRIWFFILVLLLGFFTYNIYAYKIFSDNNLCCSNPIRQGYSGIIVGICSIILLGILLSKLSYLIKSYKENSDKGSPN